jgi:preprotein translocase subunit YajC
MNLIEMLALAAVDAAPGQTPPPNQGLYMILMVSAFLALFYFIILRPQNREKQAKEDLRTNVKKGDKVKMISGAYGTIAAVDSENKIVTVQFDKNVKIDFDRDAIQTIIRKDDDKA